MHAAGCAPRCTASGRWSCVPVAWILAFFAWPWQCNREAQVLIQMSDPRACPKNLRRRSMLAGLRYNVAPGEYGSYGLWRDGTAPADSWVYNLESMAVTAALTDRSVRDLTGDKVAFADFCRDRCDMPVADTLAVFRKGRCIRPFPDDKLPGVELVSKPVHAAHATGFQVWRPEDHAFRCVSDPSGPIVPEDAFADHLADLSNRYAQGLLVQPFLHSHPEVAHLDEGGPPVARIITGRWKSGTVEVLDAILQKPPCGKYLMTGGSMRLIDVEAGRAKDIHSGAHLFPDNTADPVFDDLLLPGLGCLPRWPDHLAWGDVRTGSAAGLGCHFRTRGTNDTRGKHDAIRLCVPDSRTGTGREWPMDEPACGVRRMTMLIAGVLRLDGATPDREVVERMLDVLQTGDKPAAREIATSGPFCAGAVGLSPNTDLPPAPAMICHDGDRLLVADVRLYGGTADPLDALNQSIRQNDCKAGSDLHGDFAIADWDGERLLLGRDHFRRSAIAVHHSGRRLPGLCIAADSTAANRPRAAHAGCIGHGDIPDHGVRDGRATRTSTG